MTERGRNVIETSNLTGSLKGLLLSAQFVRAEARGAERLTEAATPFFAESVERD